MNQTTRAYVIPLMVFMAFLPVNEIITLRNPESPWWRQAPELWIYPIQVILCLGLLWYYRRCYTFVTPKRSAIACAILIGALGFFIWITPSFLGYTWSGERSAAMDFLGFKSRTEGFDPTIIEESPLAFTLTIALRFLRLVVCVPLVEEIFWRGFLMRTFAKPNRRFHQIPIGSHSWQAFFVTTVSFILIHSPADYIGAACFGAMIYLLTVRTGNLWAPVIAHGITNLALGIYVMTTKQWGFW